ncbi:MAG: sugar phosphate isomerase/epimerase [Bacteroidales bacterium]|nr:sugar phosphate isomerase/epimerase [Bacteroidales bacterium]
MSISNIGWNAEDDYDIYKIMRENDFWGLEIAPTRVFQNSPYDKLNEAKKWSDILKREEGLEISSIQSIWYGRQEKLFGSLFERQALKNYTKKAIDFAALMGCKNLVFGCPKNRVIAENDNPNTAIEFFKELGDYAELKGTILSLEANPTIYNTNYINDTLSAIELVKNVNSKGFLLNLDTGTMIYNNETVGSLINNVKYINHVHISEPELKPIQRRNLHTDLISLLKQENYKRFISIEIGRQDDKNIIKNAIFYLNEVIS